MLMLFFLLAGSGPGAYHGYACYAGECRTVHFASRCVPHQFPDTARRVQ